MEFIEESSLTGSRATFKLKDSPDLSCWWYGTIQVATYGGIVLELDDEDPGCDLNMTGLRGLGFYFEWGDIDHMFVAPLGAEDDEFAEASDLWDRHIKRKREAEDVALRLKQVTEAERAERNGLALAAD